MQRVVRYIFLLCFVTFAAHADSLRSGVIVHIMSENRVGATVYEGFYLKTADGSRFSILLSEHDRGVVSSIVEKEPLRQFQISLSDVPNSDGFYSATVVDAGAPTAPLLTGAKTIAFIFFTISGTTATATAADATRSVQTGYFYNGDTTVSTIFNSNSYGALTVASHTSFGPYALPVTLPGACSGGFYTTLDSAFNSALSSNGISTSSYDYIVYVVPQEVGDLCGWLGTTWGPNEVAVADNVNPVLVSHEIGHLFGMGHATYDADNNGVISGAAGDYEYGDPTCIMGGVGKFYNLTHEVKQDWWYAAGGGLETSPGTGSVSYSLRPFEATPASIAGATQLVQINVSDGSAYFVSFAKNIGTPDSSYDLNDYSNNHVFVTRAYPLSSKTYLVGVVPSGGSFSDDAHSITVEFLSQSGQVASVRVTTGPLDSDGDGTLNSSDTDDDNDGVLDTSDCADTSPTQWTNQGFVDADGDGYGSTEAATTLPICYGSSVPEGYLSTSRGKDNCSSVYNPDQADSDGDGLGNACESNGRATVIITSGTRVKTVKKSYSVLGMVSGLGTQVAYCSVKAPGARAFSNPKAAQTVSSTGNNLSIKCQVKMPNKGSYGVRVIGCDSRGCAAPKTATITRK